MRLATEETGRSRENSTMPTEATNNLTKRKVKAMETKRSLFEAGSRLIAERGIEHVTADDIVAECGVAKGTFFFHFQSMGNFIGCIAQQNESAIAETVEGSRGLPLPERLELFAREWLGTLTILGTALVRQLMTYGLDESSDINEFAHTMLRKILQEAVESGELASDYDVDACESFLYAHLYGMAFTWCADGGKDVPDFETSMMKPMLDLAKSIES